MYRDVFHQFADLFDARGEVNEIGFGAGTLTGKLIDTLPADAAVPPLEFAVDLIIAQTAHAEVRTEFKAAFARAPPRRPRSRNARRKKARIERSVKLILK